jgi:heat shock protein HslJ
MRTHTLLPLSFALLASCASPGASPAQPSLDSTTWRLVELAGTPAIDGDRGARLTFLGDGITGTTGCNRLSGTFTRSGEELRFGPAATTRMACVDPRLNQQERDFLAALGATDRHRVAGDTLVLLGRSGPVARLVRVPAP